MMAFPWAARRWTRVSLAFGLVLLGGGCRSRETQFRLNLVYVRNQEKAVRGRMSGRHRQGVFDVLAMLFGTPDRPRLPQLPGVGIADVAQAGALETAAGPISSDEAGRPRGSYRKHCAPCHGVTGDGAGPAAAFMDPYPRDFRVGVFKFKSTPLGCKPTHEDLKLILANGVPGTAMPSYRVLDDDELESLTRYVEYLSIRGAVERALIYESANELEEGDRLVEIARRGRAGADLAGEQFDLVRTITADEVGKWREAPSLAKAPPDPAGRRDPAESAKLGDELFHGPVANCAKCHGDLALGDGLTNDYDSWTKEIDPTTPSVVREYLQMGALPPRNIRPRNLRQGVFRGGVRPSDLFLRIQNGIDGTPMPAILWKPDNSPAAQKGATTSDIWDLVSYVRSLPRKPIGEAARRPPPQQAGVETVARPKTRILVDASCGRKIPNPKHEIPNKSKIQNRNVQNGRCVELLWSSAIRALGFEFVLNLFRIWCFGFGISNRFG
jgi:mono/diheme cytochrome c family protein